MSQNYAVIFYCTYSYYIVVLIQMQIYLTMFHLICTGDAELNISATTSSTPCYGDVVTLVCHHPELGTNHMHGKYRTSIPQWRENGSSITPTVASVFTAITAQDLMSTALTINITVDHFGNKSLGYSCFLVLDENGKPGGLDSSQEVTVDPVGECLKGL